MFDVDDYGYGARMLVVDDEECELVTIEITYRDGTREDATYRNVRAVEVTGG